MRVTCALSLAYVWPVTMRVFGSSRGRTSPTPTYCLAVISWERPVAYRLVLIREHVPRDVRAHVKKVRKIGRVLVVAVVGHEIER